MRSPSSRRSCSCSGSSSSSWPSSSGTVAAAACSGGSGATTTRDQAAGCGAQRLEHRPRPLVVRSPPRHRRDPGAPPRRARARAARRSARRSSSRRPGGSSAACRRRPRTWSRCGRSPDDPAAPRLDFVLGLPRSGSTWLGRALGRHPEVAVFGETCFFGRLYVEPRKDGLYGAEELERVRRIQRARDWETTTTDRTSWEPPWRARRVRGARGRRDCGARRPPVAPHDVLSAIATAVAARGSKPRAIEKTPQHVHWLPRVAASFPEARFVLTIRDPYEYMASYKRLGRRAGRQGEEDPRQLVAASADRRALLALVRRVDRAVAGELPRPHAARPHGGPAGAPGRDARRPAVVPGATRGRPRRRPRARTRASARASRGRCGQPTSSG